MTLAIYFLIGLIIAIYGSYVLKYQRATQYWGRILAGEKSIEKIAEESLLAKGYVDRKLLSSEARGKNGFQEAITPPILANAVFLLLLACISFLVYGIITFSWLYGIITFVGLFFTMQFFTRLYPHHFSDYWKKKLIQSLNLRKAKYENNGYTSKMEAVSYFKTQLENAQHD
ncbi:MAG: hypothetical protein HY842_17060 [Bacteroidetes bacterium]|nr:hypothetical protein [Bacteroidota bacterium]